MSTDEHDLYLAASKHFWWECHLPNTPESRAFIDSLMHPAKTTFRLSALFTKPGHAAMRANYIIERASSALTGDETAKSELANAVAAAILNHDFHTLAAVADAVKRARDRELDDWEMLLPTPPRPKPTLAFAVFERLVACVIRDRALPTVASLRSMVDALAAEGLLAVEFIDDKEFRLARKDLGLDDLPQDKRGRKKGG